MVFYHEDNLSTFSNPGMGWVIHHSIQKLKKDPNEPDTYDKLDNVALLSWWGALEKEDSGFVFDDLDSSIEQWTKEGKKLQFRISTDPMIYSGNVEGAPNWIYDKYRVPYKTVSEDGYSTRFPDYLNSSYQTLLRRFLCELADRYGDLDNLETVDLRGYGTWGEWHSGYEYNSIAQRVAALKSIIDAWDYAFSGRKTLVLSCSYEWMNNRKPPLHAPKSYEEYLYWSAFDYALSKPGISFRRDGIGGAVKMWDARLMNEFYNSSKRLPMITEFFDGYVAKSSAGGTRGYFVEDSMEEAIMLHPNYMMLMWDSIPFYNERQDLIDYGLRRMGYRLLPRRVEIPNANIKDKYLTLKHSWVNLGAGKFCSKGLLKIRIEGRITEEFGFDPGSLLEDKPKEYLSSVRLPDNLSPGVYPVEFAVFGYNGEAVNLPLEGRKEGGYYQIGMVTIGNSN